MQFLFVYHSPDVLGGIETLIGRMSRSLINRGHGVTLITTTTSRWKEIIPPEVRTICLGRQYRNLFYPILAKRQWLKLNLPQPDVIKTFDLPSSWAGCLIASNFRVPTKLVSGIYNPHVFDHKLGGQVLMNGWPLYLHNFLKNIPHCSRIFCDPQEIRELRHVYGNTQDGKFWPIPVDGMKFQDVTRSPKWGKIVSIGRLAPMKEYNLYMVDCIKQLRSRGYNVCWHVYGSGVFEADMRKRILSEGLDNAIKLEGEIPYARIGDALKDAYIFIGMGTTLLEASFCRVPNVVAIAYETNGMTYGSISKCPFGATGQKLDYPPLLRVEDEIARILDMAPDDYRKEASAVYECVQRYEQEQVMTGFEEIVRECQPVRIDNRLYFGNFLYALCRQVGIRLDDYTSRRIPAAI